MAVASTEYDSRSLTGSRAHDPPLTAIRFRDPRGALSHIAALTKGVSRKKTVQRTLLPVMLRWFAEGVDPDYGLVAYRRISERLGDSPATLRMLRDSTGAAESLTMLLSGSRYVGELMEWIPESVAWLDSAEQLRPRAYEVLRHEASAVLKRRTALPEAARRIREIRRRELLRTAMASMTGSLSIKDVTTSLTAITDVTIQSLLVAVRREVVPAEHRDMQFAIIGMGRYGGAEVGFGSDAMSSVYRPGTVDPQVGLNLSRGRSSPSCANSRTTRGCRSSSTPSCAPRVGRGRSPARSMPIARTTRGGRCRGRLRRSCARVPSRAMTSCSKT